MNIHIFNVEKSDISWHVHHFSLVYLKIRSTFVKYLYYTYTNDEHLCISYSN